MIRTLIWGLVLLVPGPAALTQDSPKDKEGKAELKVEGKLSPDDPKDKDRKGSPHQVHTFKMQAGKTYVIDLVSRQFDAYLRLEDSTGLELAFNDDAAPGNLNSQIVFQARKDDDYRLIVTSYDGKSGAFTLTAQVVNGKLTAAQGLALAQGLRDAYEKAYQHKDKAAGKMFQEAQGEAKKLAEDFPNLATQSKALLFTLEHLSVGRKAMEIEGEDLDGKKFKLSDYRGKVVVLDFWGNW